MKAGFSRLDITPPLGAVLNGYYRERYADGILEKLYVNTIAFSDGESTAVAISLDISEILQRDTDIIRKLVAERTGLPFEAIFVACIHTHTAPVISEIISFFKCDPNYIDFFHKKICDSAVFAIEDMKEAKAYIARRKCEGISFLRRFRMPDGSISTNPPQGASVEGPAGEVDETVQLVRLTREGASDIAIINFGTHPDVIGGTKICPDWPGFLRIYLEQAMADVANGKGLCAIFFNGAQGDVAHADRFDPKTKTLTKPVRKGVEHSRYMGRALAGAVMQMYDYAEEVNSDKVFFKQTFAKVAVNKGTPEQVEWARKRNQEFLDAVDKRGIPTEVVEARRYLRLENVEPWVDLNVVTVGFGDVAFVGFPGEPFTKIGTETKNNSPFAMTLPCCNANGSEGYFPTDDALIHKGYEGTSSLFLPGVAGAMIDTADRLLKEVNEEIKK